MNADDTGISPLTDLAGVLPYNPVWYWIALFIVIGTILLASFFLLRITSKDGPQTINRPAQRTPASMINEIDKIYIDMSYQNISLQEGYHRVSLILKEYLFLQTGLPATTMTLADLEARKAPPRVLENMRYLYPIVFGNQKVATQDELMAFMSSARTVLEGKWR